MRMGISIIIEDASNFPTARLHCGKKDHIDSHMRMVSYFLLELSRSQFINNIAKYIAPMANTIWKNPYL